MELLKKEINRTLDIMNNFSDYTKINIEKKIMDINKLIVEVKESLGTLLEKDNIKVVYNNKNKIEINGDYERLKQVLINIIKNYIEAIESIGIIEIKVNEFKDYIEINIKDNGVGMNEETMNKIEEMFYTTKREGSGIGIPLCKEIIEQHNGKFKIFSKENVGTEVRIKIPKNLQ